MREVGRWTVAVALIAVVAGCSAGTDHRPVTATSGPSGSSSPAAPALSRAPSTAPPASRPPVSSPAPRTSPAAKPSHTSAGATTAARHRGRSLPLGFHTGSARQVITVVGASTRSTEAVLQTWRKVTGGWRAVGPRVDAWVGSDGLTEHPSETRSATPIGSFTLTRAFGHDPDPGTSLPYVRTTPDDWWISQPGPLYNTRQRCRSACAFTRGDPNEHLFYETPYYDYAAVIDYNTRNAPGGVRQGAGSAFFLHVTVGEPTAGCVSIPKPQLVRILRWLAPAKHPRILIGAA